MDDLGKGSEAVGGARGVGDNVVLGLVSVQVDTADEPMRCQFLSMPVTTGSLHRGISGRS